MVQFFRERQGKRKTRETAYTKLSFERSEARRLVARVLGPLRSGVYTKKSVQANLKQLSLVVYPKPPSSPKFFSEKASLTAALAQAVLVFQFDRVYVDNNNRNPVLKIGLVAFATFVVFLTASVTTKLQEPFWKRKKQSLQKIAVCTFLELLQSPQIKPPTKSKPRYL